MIKMNESSCLKYWNVNNLYGQAMSQKLPVNGLKLIKDTSQFNQDFIKNCNRESDEGYFLKVDVQYTDYMYYTNQITFMIVCHFQQNK